MTPASLLESMAILLHGGLSSAKSSLAVLGGFATLHQPQIPCEGIALSRGILARERGEKEDVTLTLRVFQVRSCSLAGFWDQRRAHRGPVDLRECA